MSKTSKGRSIVAPHLFTSDFSELYPGFEASRRRQLLDAFRRRNSRTRRQRTASKPKKAKKVKASPASDEVAEKPAKKQKKSTKKSTIKQKSPTKTKPAKKTKAPKKKGSKKKAEAKKEAKTTPPPSIKRTGSVRIERGEEHVLQSSVGKIEMGLGWSTRLDIDAGVLIFDAKYQHVETVDFRHLKSDHYDITHSGDILDGASHAKTDGDDEKIRVNLSTLPADITTLMFIATIYTDGKTWNDVKDGRIRLVDLGSNTEKCRYECAPKTFGLTRAAVLCKVYKSRDGHWKMMSIGEPIADLSIKEPRLASPHLSAFVYEDYVPADATVETLSS